MLFMKASLASGKNACKVRVLALVALRQQGTTSPFEGKDCRRRTSSCELSVGHAYSLVLSFAYSFSQLR